MDTEHQATEASDVPRESGHLEGDAQSGSTRSWFGHAARAAAPVLAVAAVVAVAATGAGLLVPGIELSASARQMVRIAGLVVAVVGLVALVIYRRRHPAPPGHADPMMVALLAAAAIMAALTVLSLPFSPGLTFSSDDRQVEGGGLTNIDSTTGTSGTGEGVGGGRGTIGAPTGFTVAVDPATGETTPIAIDPDTGRAVAFDPETGETVPLSFDSTGAGGEGGLQVPVGIDRTTGEIGIIGIVDPETGEVGIIGGRGSGVDFGALDPATLDGLVEITGGDLDNISAVGTIDPGRRPDGRIDFSRFDFDDVEFNGPAGSSTDTLDWDRITREIEVPPPDESGTGDAGTANEPGDTSGDTGDAASDTGSRRSDSRILIRLLQVALLVLAVIFAVRMRGWRPSSWRQRRPADADMPVDAQQAEEGLTASLHAMTDSGEPREGIIAAYIRLLQALEAAGAPRLAHEAPHEHLDRVLTPLGVRPDPVHRLAELFVMARFSEHSITEHHRTEAADALRVSLADLRAAADAAGHEAPAATGGRWP